MRAPSETSRRRTRGHLDSATIAEEARAIAESEGLANVTMRAIAERLDCTPRALYRHIGDKEQLLELVADTAFADLQLPPSSVGWQDGLHAYFTDMRTLLLTSPAIATIIAGQTVAGAEFRRQGDHLVALMTSAGFDIEVAVEAIFALSFLTLGASLPGTGQALLDVHRQRVTGLLPGDESAEQYFHAALTHHIQGYAARESA